jgi:hypothetical protein
MGKSAVDMGFWGDAMKMEMKRKLPQIVAFWLKSLPICLPTITQTHRNG